MICQCTISKPSKISGIGLHTGNNITMRLHPAPANTGVIFHKTDGEHTQSIKATSANVVDTKMATVIGANNVSVSTIEHFMAALTACHIDNLHVYIDGPEVPIMDGSAAPFINLLQKTGVSRLNTSRKMLVINKPIKLVEGDKQISIIPSRFFKISFSLSFNHPCVREQHRSVNLTPESLRQEVASARTFGFYEEVEYLKSIGLARGGSLQNAVVIGKDKIINPEGLRYHDEFVRHKILDTIGDFSLLGYNILGHIKSDKSGHDLNHKMVEKILATPDSWRIVEFSEADLNEAIKLPVQQLQPDFAWAKS
ncbi:MAG: UDP-3-O-[3-hydroxymyristoyl] N-acetylglucosamine deacetylase [Desulfobacteraceae bacterium 4572_35.1]|nr:MAG: UDP-3-O-[3-hydroxymyristoyl] N-acetylglucosamine deacetylase [Desulfobacteraceae bacterium 4572_35.1]